MASYTGRRARLVTPLDPDRARELSRAARQVTSWRERRDRLIREAVEEHQAGVREVARCVELSHPTILKIVKDGKQTATTPPTDADLQAQADAARAGHYGDLT